MTTWTDDAAALREQVIALGPWHLAVDVTPEVSTRAWVEAAEAYLEEWGPVSFVDPAPFRSLLRRLYPQGLEGRSFLDCACNCGAYSLLAQELGAGRSFGFDVREHWIRQARFLLEHRRQAAGSVRFETCDLYDLPGLGLEPFDVTLFKGIFYHLSDPVTGLKIAADLTREVLILNTATRAGQPDGLLAIETESREQLMSGVHGLNWLPTGPEVLGRILRWAGFVETHLLWWQQESQPRVGRLELLAAKTPGLLMPFTTRGAGEKGDDDPGRAAS